MSKFDSMSHQNAVAGSMPDDELANSIPDELAQSKPDMPGAKQSYYTKGANGVFSIPGSEYKYDRENGKMFIPGAGWVPVSPNRHGFWPDKSLEGHIAKNPNAWAEAVKFLTDVEGDNPIVDTRQQQLAGLDDFVAKTGRATEKPTISPGTSNVLARAAEARRQRQALYESGEEPGKPPSTIAGFNRNYAIGAPPSGPSDWNPFRDYDPSAGAGGPLEHRPIREVLERFDGAPVYGKPDQYAFPYGLVWNAKDKTLYVPSINMYIKRAPNGGLVQEDGKSINKQATPAEQKAVYALLGAPTDLWSQFKSTAARTFYGTAAGLGRGMRDIKAAAVGPVPPGETDYLGNAAKTLEERAEHFQAGQAHNLAGDVTSALGSVAPFFVGGGVAAPETLAANITGRTAMGTAMAAGGYGQRSKALEDRGYQPLDRLLRAGSASLPDFAVGAAMAHAGGPKAFDFAKDVIQKPISAATAFVAQHYGTALLQEALDVTPIKDPNESVGSWVARHWQDGGEHSALTGLLFELVPQLPKILHLATSGPSAKPDVIKPDSASKPEAVSPEVAPDAELQALLRKTKRTDADNKRIVELTRPTTTQAQSEAPAAEPKLTDLSQRELPPDVAQEALKYMESRQGRPSINEESLPSPGVVERLGAGKGDAQRSLEDQIELGPFPRELAPKEAGSSAKEGRRADLESGMTGTDPIDILSREREVQDRMKQLEGQMLRRSGGAENRGYRRLLERNPEYQQLREEANLLQSHKEASGIRGPGDTADSLGLQQLYEFGVQKLGLPKDASASDVAKAVLNRIGEMGKTVAETVQKIMEKIPEVTRDIAERIAFGLHNDFNMFEDHPGEHGGQSDIAAPEVPLSERGEAFKRWATENPGEFKRQWEARQEARRTGPVAEPGQDSLDAQIVHMGKLRWDMTKLDPEAKIFGGALEPALDVAKKVLGLDPNANHAEIARALVGKINGLGKTVMETAVKLMSKVKDLGREAAIGLAKHLHEAFSGSRDSQKGAIGPDINADATARARAELAVKREEIKNSGMSKDERAAAYRKLGSLKDMATRMSTPADSAEATRLSNAANDTSLPVKDRQLAAARVAEGMKNGVVPDVTKNLGGTPKDMKTFLNAIGNLIGNKVINEETGSPVVVRTFINHDIGETADSIRRDLTKLESKYGKIGSPSQTVTGGSFGSLKVNPDRSIGAMSEGNNHVGDMVAAQTTAIANMSNHYNHFIENMKKSGIEDNGRDINKRLKPSIDNYAEAHGRFDKISDYYERTPTAENKKRLDDARAELENAKAALLAHQQIEARNPDHASLRVSLLADKIGKGEDIPDWLKSVSSEKEVEAAKTIASQMAEIKKAAKESGVPIREDYGIPHLWTDVVDSGILKEGKEWGRIQSEYGFKPEGVKFKERSDTSILLSGDIFGTMAQYLPKAMDTIARRQVVEKWKGVASIIHDKPLLQEQIERDMKAYSGQFGGNDPVLESLNNVMTNLLIGFSHKVGMKHAMKAVGEAANLRPIDAAAGYASYLKEAWSNPELKKILGDAGEFGRGPRYSNIDTSEGSGTVGGARSFWKKLVTASHYPTQGIESVTRQAGTRANIVANFQAGMSPEAALYDALYRSALVNFHGVDKPALMRTSVGRTIFYLQNTVWKIMEMNMRAAMDGLRATKRIPEGLLTDNILGEQEKRRYAEAARHAMALYAVYQLGKKTDTDMFHWIWEFPTFIKAFIVQPVEDVVHNLTTNEKKVDPLNVAPTLRQGTGAVPIIAKTLDSAEKYGLGNQVFWRETLTPEFIKMLTTEPGKTQKKASSEGPLGVMQRGTGLTSASIKEKENMKFRLKQEQKQRHNVKKQERRYSRGLDQFKIPDNDPLATSKPDELANSTPDQ